MKLVKLRCKKCNRQPIRPESLFISGVAGSSPYYCPNCGEIMEEIKTIGCNLCGGQLVEIRGRDPRDPKRKVCPTCLQERLEQINDISSSGYGVACQDATKPITPGDSDKPLKPRKIN